MYAVRLQPRTSTRQHSTFPLPSCSSTTQVRWPSSTAGTARPYASSLPTSPSLSHLSSALLLRNQANHPLFKCEAFVWAGPGHTCYTFGSILNQTVPSIDGAPASLYQRPILSGNQMETKKDYEHTHHCRFRDGIQVSQRYIHDPQRGEEVSLLPSARSDGSDDVSLVEFRLARNFPSTFCGAYCWSRRSSCQSYAVSEGRCFHLKSVPYFVLPEYKGDVSLFVLSCVQKNDGGNSLHHLNCSLPNSFLPEVPIPFANNTDQAKDKILEIIKKLRKPKPKFLRNVTFDTERGKLAGIINCSS